MRRLVRTEINERGIAVCSDSTLDLGGPKTNSQFHLSNRGVVGARWWRDIGGSPLLPVAGAFAPLALVLFCRLRVSFSESLVRLTQVFAVFTVRVRAIW